jgi:hypothetical protein
MTMTFSSISLAMPLGGDAATRSVDATFLHALDRLSARAERHAPISR